MALAGQADINEADTLKELSKFQKKMHKGYFKHLEPKVKLYLEQIEDVPILCQ